MVKLPPPFIAIKYPGYFFNTEDEKLYSMKVDGILKPLGYHPADPFNHIGNYPTKLPNGDTVYSKGGYRLSVKGMRRFVAIEYLKALEDHDATIPVREEA